MKKACLVTSSLVGPTKNGGVGTAISYLAIELEKAGFDVTILFNGIIQCETEQYWIQQYSELHIKFQWLQSYVQENYGESGVSDQNWWTWRSYWTYRYLEKHDFDIAHFPETCGYAYHTIQAKRTTNLFKNMKIVVTMHSSTEWLKEGMDVFHLEDGDEDRANLLYLKLNYAERYTCQYCDYLLAPSEFMFQWAIKRGWTLCEKREVAFNAYSTMLDKTYSEAIDYDHFIFFGRMEKQKGIDSFCECMNKLYDSQYKETECALKVSFLGRNAMVDGMRATEYIDKNLNKAIQTEIHTDYDTFQAMEYIKQSNGICVMSSSLDNSPYSIVECIENCIPFVCSKTGGIPELVNEKILFDPGADTLYEFLTNIKNIDFRKIRHKYSFVTANKNLVEIHKRICDMKIQESEFEKPLVSVCVAYRAQSIFIYDMLQSIFENSYPNIEIIIALEDDRCFEKEEVEQFNFRNITIKYVDNTKKTKGHGYNICAQVACGKYLLFINPEDIMEKDYIEKCVYGIQKSESDAVATHSKKIFGIGRCNLIPGIRNVVNIPIGQNKELSLFENTYSDSSFMVSKEAFDLVGGFEEGDSSGLEWNFMNRLSVKRAKMEVIPICGFRIRDVAPELRNKICYPNLITCSAHKMAIAPLLEEMPDYMHYFLYHWCLGRYYEEVLTKSNKSRFQYLSTAKKRKVELSIHNSQVRELRAKIANLENQISVLNMRCNDFLTGINNYEESFFWKITKPCRKVLDMVRRNKK